MRSVTQSHPAAARPGAPPGLRARRVDDTGREPADPPSNPPPLPPRSAPQPSGPAGSSAGPPPDDGDDEAPEAAVRAPDVAGPPVSAAPTVPPFTPTRLRRQLVLDSVLHGLAVLVLVASLFGLLALTADGGSVVNVVPVLLVLVGWMMVNLISARVSRELPQLSVMIAEAPEAGERRLAEHMRRRPLLRWVRLMLYHRLALLRHRQRRFAEAAAICRAVLSYRLGPARASRSHLLLMWTEAAMECRDLASAFGALSELHRLRLSLVEALQRLALQTRYELLAGHDAAVLLRREQKVQLAELMPATQCGAMHAMLATAADHAHDHGLARSLWARVELLATPDQLARFRAGEFGVEMVDALRPMPHSAAMNESNEAPGG